MMTVAEIKEAIERLPPSELSQLALWIEGYESRQTKWPSPRERVESKNVRLPGDGSFQLEVVGESHYQEALESICGGRTAAGVDHQVSARLIAEDTNQYDKQAVRVEVEGRTIGYLSKADAKAYRNYMQMYSIEESAGWCSARMLGGWKRGKEQGHFGVQLDFLLYG